MTKWKQKLGEIPRKLSVKFHIAVILNAFLVWTVASPSELNMLICWGFQILFRLFFSDQEESNLGYRWMLSIKLTRVEISQNWWAWIRINIYLSRNYVYVGHFGRVFDRILRAFHHGPWTCLRVSRPCLISQLLFFGCNYTPSHS